MRQTIWLKKSQVRRIEPACKCFYSFLIDCLSAENKKKAPKAKPKQAAKRKAKGAKPKQAAKRKAKETKPKAVKRRKTAAQKRADGKYTSGLLVFCRSIFRQQIKSQMARHGS